MLLNLSDKMNLKRSWWGRGIGWNKHKKLIVGEGGGGWNSWEGWKKVTILVAREKVSLIAFSFPFLTMKTTVLRTFVYMVKVK